MARQWVPCHADAEDIVQTAFVRFWKRADQARDPVAYLYRTVRTTAMNHHRSRTRRKHHEDAAASQPRREAMFADPAARAEQAELGERVGSALDTLPIEQREVVVMRVWGQLSFEAIGEAAEVPARTAQSRYRYGIEALRRAINAAQGVAS
jgi:RNA polymerase sigma-70 factor (ECF subfamily)